MPWFSASSTAFSVTTWRSIRASVSCSSRTRRASRTVSCRCCVLLGHDALEHALEIDVHLLHAEVGEDLHRHGLLLDVQLDHAVLQLAGFQAGLHLVAACAGWRSFSSAFSGSQLPDCGSSRSSSRSVTRSLACVSTSVRCSWRDHADGDLGQVADHAFHVAAVVADLGVLGGLDLEERGADELGQPAGDLGFADAGGADHDDVLGRHVLAQLGGQLLPPPAIADGHGHGPLGRVLADDVAVQLLHDLPRRQVCHDNLQ